MTTKEFENIRQLYNDGLIQVNSLDTYNREYHHTFRNLQIDKDMFVFLDYSSKYVRLKRKNIKSIIWTRK